MAKQNKKKSYDTNLTKEKEEEMKGKEEKEREISKCV